MFDLALENSILRKRQDETDEQIKKLWIEVANLKIRDNDLQQNIEVNEMAARDALQASKDKQDEENKSIRSAIKEANKQITFGKEVAKQQ